MAALLAAARALSLNPGVYLFKDARGRVLYVGKAKALKKRVLQYFDTSREASRGRQSARLDPPKQEMMTRAVGIETITTATEAEALVLEATFIQKHDPPYNVRLADDSSYLYVRISNEPYPAVSLTRRVLPDGAWYRGPYPSSRAIRQTLKEARKLFGWCAYPNPDASKGPARTAAQSAAGRRACFAYHLGLCPGICVRALSLEEYQQNIERLKRFLDGDTAAALRTLRTRMDHLSQTQAYERAARIRDAMRAIEQATIPQDVVTPREESLDVIGLARHGTHASAAVMHVRHGRVISTQVFPLLHPPDDPTEEILRGFTIQYYRSAQDIPPTVLLPKAITDAPAIAEWLSKETRRRVRLGTAERGWKRNLRDIAAMNADDALKKSLTELTSPANVTTALNDLAKALHLPEPPHRIETFDISNIQGTLATASMIVFVDGKSAPSQYRKFRIASQHTPNDVGMMREVLTRRFKRTGKESGKEWPLPGLILLDGGKPQLNAGAAVLASLNVSVPLAAIAKREEELFLPKRPSPIVLPRTSPALYLIQRMRDEAHRFTITYHRLLRKKRMTRSVLEDIPGVGPATRKKLLRAFGSVAGIRAASKEELANVLGSTHRGDIVHRFLYKE